MAEVTVTEMPKDHGDRVFKISDEKEVLGFLYIRNNRYIWSGDLFATKKISRKTAINHYRNDKNVHQ
jgi:hypothetical protein